MSASRSSTATLIAALYILARHIKSDDGMANAAITEAAERLAELRLIASDCADIVRAQQGAEHMLDGFRIRPRPIIDGLVARINAELAS